MAAAKSLLDRTEVHGLLDDVEVVRDPKLDDVHWLVKDPGLRHFPEGRMQALRCLVPMVIDWALIERDSVAQSWLESEKLLLVVEILRCFWVLLLKLRPVLKCDPLAIDQACKNKVLLDFPFCN